MSSSAPRSPAARPSFLGSIIWSGPASTTFPCGRTFRRRIRSSRSRPSSRSGRQTSRSTSTTHSGTSRSGPSCRPTDGSSTAWSSSRTTPSTTHPPLGDDVEVELLLGPDATNYPVTLVVVPAAELRLKVLVHGDRMPRRQASTMARDLRAVLAFVAGEADATVADVLARLPAETRGQSRRGRSPARRAGVGSLRGARGADGGGRRRDLARPLPGRADRHGRQLLRSRRPFAPAACGRTGGFATRCGRTSRSRCSSSTRPSARSLASSAAPTAEGEAARGSARRSRRRRSRACDSPGAGGSRVLRRLVRRRAGDRDRRARGALPGRARRRGVLAERARGPGDDRAVRRGRARAVEPVRHGASPRPRLRPSPRDPRGRRPVRRRLLPDEPARSRRDGSAAARVPRDGLGGAGARGLRPGDVRRRDRRVRGDVEQHATSWRTSTTGPTSSSQAGELPMLGNEKDYLATRVSYKLDLRGPSINVQSPRAPRRSSPCCQAVQALATHQCDMALAGGVVDRRPAAARLPVPGGRHHSHPTGIAARSTRTPPGTVFSQRARHRRAEAARGRARRRRRRSTPSSRASASTTTAPARSASRRRAWTARPTSIAMAQAIAGIDPDTIGYVEAHGTGTALGDPDRGRRRSRRPSALVTDETGFCALGSVKTNIGHLDAAAGVAGLIKTALALHHGTAPADAPLRRAEPEARLPGVAVLRQLRAARLAARGRAPRRAGVSSFGVGRHERPRRARGGACRGALRARRAPSSSCSFRPQRSRARGRRRNDAASSSSGDPDVALADVAYTLQVGRRRFEHRRAFVATSRDDAIELLSSATRSASSRTSRTPRAPVAFLFPGQGAQCVNMGRDLYESEPVFRAEIDACAELLRPLLDRDLREILYPSDDARGDRRVRADADGDHAAGAVCDELRARAALGAAGASRPTR